ncbi:glycosyltransferase [Flavobacteriaceae bacterium]|nr:glycosyltransferase [Flavobacteriaceae bacterium]MDC3269468.1 glycosyltransferase [Flavobacteriaceae bacterium]
MKILYIGQYTKGTTSSMRGVAIKEILNPKIFDVIDTHLPFFKTHRLWRSIGFRYKSGPLITNTNKFIVTSLKQETYDLIWVDKAVFITPNTTSLLKQKTSKLVHSTPDMAFYANKSKLFYASLSFYDFCITTKTVELDVYHKYLQKPKVLFMPQGFSKKNHKPHHSFSQKEDAIVFIGLAEPSRFKIAEVILANNLKLKLVGFGWGSFVAKHKNNKNLQFLGTALYEDDYSHLISSSKFALGLLSKQFKELHTTRTFEIPACGTALLTEQNQELNGFFENDEVIFYKNQNELISKIKYFIEQEQELEELTKKGFEKVHNRGYDYKNNISKILNQILD